MIVYMETMRSVLITGGSQGIGQGLAERYRARGARVIVVGRDRQRLEQAAARLPGLETVVNDLSDPAERARLAAYIAESMPRTDLVVNNAGIQRRVALAEDDAAWAERQAEIDLLLAAPIHLNYLLIPTLLAHGAPARIVNVTSGGGFIPQPFAPVYSASKAALHSYTVNLRLALAGTPVRVTELIPPAVATGLGDRDNPHGAPVDEFCDAAAAGIDSGMDVVGFGPTASEEFMERLRTEQARFQASAGRFPFAGYAEISR